MSNVSFFDKKISTEVAKSLFGTEFGKKSTKKQIKETVDGQIRLRYQKDNSFEMKMFFEDIALKCPQLKGKIIKRMVARVDGELKNKTIEDVIAEFEQIEDKGVVDEIIGKLAAKYRNGRSNCERIQVSNLNEREREEYYREYWRINKKELLDDENISEDKKCQLAITVMGEKDGKEYIQKHIEQKNEEKRRTYGKPDLTVTKGQNSNVNVNKMKFNSETKDPKVDAMLKVIRDSYDQHRDYVATMFGVRNINEYATFIKNPIDDCKFGFLEKDMVNLVLRCRSNEAVFNGVLKVISDEEVQVLEVCDSLDATYYKNKPILDMIGLEKDEMIDHFIGLDDEEIAQSCDKLIKEENREGFMAFVDLVRSADNQIITEANRRLNEEQPIQIEEVEAEDGKLVITKLELVY